MFKAKNLYAKILENSKNSKPALILLKLWLLDFFFIFEKFQQYQEILCIFMQIKVTV